MSVQVFFELQANADSRDALVQMLQDILPDTRAYDGCHGASLVVNMDDSNSLMVVEQWASRAQYQAYVDWRSERGDVAMLAAMLAQPPVIRCYQ